MEFGALCWFSEADLIAGVICQSIPRLAYILEVIPVK